MRTILSLISLPIAQPDRCDCNSLLFQDPVIKHVFVAHVCAFWSAFKLFIKKYIFQMTWNISQQAHNLKQRCIYVDATSSHRLWFDVMCLLWCSAVLRFECYWILTSREPWIQFFFVTRLQWSPMLSMDGYILDIQYSAFRTRIYRLLYLLH